jgi:hypothetical protein
MDSQIKICQSCKKDFKIEPEDFDFYNNIGVPAPTWCPQCRMVRRMSWAANSITLYPRICQAPGHSERILATYPETSKVPVYDHAFYAGDGWDSLAYGRDYDFARSFFSQFKDLVNQVPVRNAEIINGINCEYSLGVTDSKNCYLCSGTFGSEQIDYGHTAVFCKECVDVTLCTFDEQVYGSFSVDKSFASTYSVYCEELINCDFMYDCRSCSDCFGCVGLRSKRFQIFNIQYSKEDYKKERAKYDLGSYEVCKSVANHFDRMILQYPRKYAVIRNAPSCTGDNLVNAKNCKYVFQALDDIENCKYAFVLGRGAKECQDVAAAAFKASRLYDSAMVITSYNVFFSYRIRDSHDAYYSRECFNCEYIFGCAGLKNKKYCILNKQYSKEDYEKLLSKIIESMKIMPFEDSKGRIYSFGEFFPPEHSLFPYNSCWANDFFPLSKERAIETGYLWHDNALRNNIVTMNTSALPDNIKAVPDSILNEIISCSHATQEGSRPEGCMHNCTGAFKIIPSELQFYRKFNVALPRECPTCRYRESLKYLTPYKLWHRKCQCQGVKQKTGYTNVGNHPHADKSCPNEFETAYAPERLELLYCEACYNSEIL